MSPSVQAIRRFLEAHDRFAAHNGITVEDADYDYGKVSLAFEDHAKNSLDMLHGGALTVRSEEGKGTTFRMEIPISTQSGEER